MYKKVNLELDKSDSSTNTFDGGSSYIHQHWDALLNSDKEINLLEFSNKIKISYCCIYLMELMKTYEGLDPKQQERLEDMLENLSDRIELFLRFSGAKDKVNHEIYEKLLDKVLGKK